MELLWPEADKPEPSRRGPRPGSSRYAEADRKLFDELEKLMLNDNLSATAAAIKLVEDGRVSGVGDPTSLAKSSGTLPA